MSAALFLFGVSSCRAALAFQFFSLLSFCISAAVCALRTRRPQQRALRSLHGYCPRRAARCCASGSVVGRAVGQAPGRQRTETQTWKKASSYARQRTGGGAAPKHRRGKQRKGGNRPQGNPTRQHPPHRESSTRRGPRCKIGRGGRRSSYFGVKQRAPPTAGSCSHRVAEKLYAGQEDPWTSA